MNHCLFLEPLDTLTPRGHRQFGAAGSFGEASMPPAPSVFAGALRSTLLCRDAQRLAACEARDAASLAHGFRLEHLSLARKTERGHEAILPLPADLVLFDDGLCRLEPRPKPHGIRCETPLPLLPVLKSGRGKPLGGCWLSENGWREYLQGHIPKGQDIVWRDALWKSETRPGIALDGTTRTGAEGALYSVEHVSLKAGIGFLAGFRCGETDWPEHGNLRLAGDGRVAQWSRIQWAPPEPPLDAIAATRRFRLVLATHGLFPDGWLPPGIDRATFALVGPGFSARLVCAAVVRSELVSGWDLFKNEPKPARRAVPAGSVYWFDNFEGDADKLAAWAKDGLWPDNDWEEPRRAEGWNRAWLAAWPGA